MCFEEDGQMAPRKLSLFAFQKISLLSRKGGGINILIEKFNLTERKNFVRWYSKISKFGIYVG